MKIVTMALALAFSSISAMAAPAEQNGPAKVIAQLAINLSETGQVGSTHGIIKVLDNQSVVLEKWSYAGADPRPTFIGTTKIQTSAKLATTLRSKIISLSDAKTKVIFSEIVCMMMPPLGPNPALFVASGYNYETNTFAGDLRVVASNTGCWDPSKTSLVNDWDITTAGSLEGALEAIALQTVK